MSASLQGPDADAPPRVATRDHAVHEERLPPADAGRPLRPVRRWRLPMQQAGVHVVHVAGPGPPPRVLSARRPGEGSTLARAAPSTAFDTYRPFSHGSRWCASFHVCLAARTVSQPTRLSTPLPSRVARLSILQPCRTTSSPTCLTSGTPQTPFSWSRRRSGACLDQTAGSHRDAWWQTHGSPTVGAATFRAFRRRKRKIRQRAEGGR